MMPSNLTPDTNDVDELKMQIKELKVSLVPLAHENDISIEELRREVNAKPMEDKKEKVVCEDEDVEEDGEKAWDEQGGVEEEEEQAEGMNKVMFINSLDTIEH